VLALAYVFVTRRRTKIYILVDHLASLARGGLPLQSGLRVLAQDLGGILGTRVARVARHLEEGRTLGEAIEAVPGAFPPLVKSMVTLGEKSGNLAAFLEELRRSYRRIAELPYQSVYIFLYPVVLSVLINLALTGLYAFIRPRLEMVWTQAMRGVPSGYEGWWDFLILANEGVLALCAVLVFAVFAGGPSPHFGRSGIRFLKLPFDMALLALPILGRIVRDASLQAFALSTGLFLRAGAALPAAALAAAEVERNAVLRRRYARLAVRLAEGDRLSTAGRADRVFPDDLAWFVETGEAAGSLPDHLLQAAVHYDTKTRFAAQVAMRALVPFFVLLNGSLVLGTCLLTFLPMTDTLKATIPW
jgi:type II secretory pathway component PulF